MTTGRLKWSWSKDLTFDIPSRRVVIDSKISWETKPVSAQSQFSRDRSKIGAELLKKLDEILMENGDKRLSDIYLEDITFSVSWRNGVDNQKYYAKISMILGKKELTKLMSVVMEKKKNG